MTRPLRLGWRELAWRSLAAGLVTMPLAVAAQEAGTAGTDDVPTVELNPRSATGTGEAGLPSGVGSLATSSLIGREMVLASGETVGELEELIVDPADGLLKFAIVSRGGVLGIGAESVQVPWDRVRLGGPQGAAGPLVIEMDMAAFELLPEWEMNRTTGGNVGAAPAQ